jgi:N-acetyl-anhydromuramyl-L-alanine amidase AmpD
LAEGAWVKLRPKALGLAAFGVLMAPVVAVSAVHHPEGGPGAAGRANPPSRLPSAGAQAATAPSRDYAHGLWEPASPHNYTVADRPLDIPINRIIIHVAEGGFRGTYQWFKNRAAASSAHYVVGSGGQVAQMVSERDIAWHAGNWPYNETSIGIEHAGFTNKTVFPDVQYRASARLAGYLARKYLIPPDRRHVIGHYQVPDPNHRGQFGGFAHHTDPGHTWNWPLYMAYLRMNANDTYQQIVDTTTPNRITHKNSKWQYRLDLPQTQSYDLFMRWPCNPPGKSATVGISTTHGYRAVHVDESRFCKRGWNRLGTFALAGGDSWKLVVSGPASANPIRVVEVTDPVLPTEPDVSIAPAAGSLHVSWSRASDNIGVGGYQLWVGGAKVYQGTGRDATATGLSCNKAYSVSVRTLDLISNRSPRDLLSATTPACPSNPTDLAVSDITNTSVKLSWSDAGGTGVGFDTYLDSVHQASTSSTSYVYTGLKCAKQYVFGVASHDAAGHISTHVHVYATAAAC